MGPTGWRPKGPAEDQARVGELRAADASAEVTARPSLLRQLFRGVTPYGGYTPAEAARAIAAGDGEQCTAVVLAAKDRPGRRFLNPPGGTVDLLLEVERPGDGSYTTRLVIGFSTAERRARVAAVGSRLPVRVNPSKPGKIAIDAAALFGRDPSSSSGKIPAP